MRIKQFHCTLPFFRKGVEDKYGLTHTDRPVHTEPLLMIGALTDQHFSMIVSNQAPVVVYWCGSDALFFLNKKNLGPDCFWAKMIRNRSYIHHIAPSHWIADDLMKMKFDNIYHLPISLINHSDITPSPLGECVYMYSPNKPTYNGGIYDEIKRRLPYEFIEATSSTFNRAELLEAYHRSFIGLRFTAHDGLAETVMEMGLMGRPMIHNGRAPNCYAYKDGDVEGVVTMIDTWYKYREHHNYLLMADSVSNYIYNSDDWLTTDFYENKRNNIMPQSLALS